MASYSARSFNSPLLFKGSLVNPRLRASFSPAHPLARRDVPLTRRAQSHRARFASTGGQQTPTFHPSPQIPHHPLGEWPRLPFTARIERYTCSLQARSCSLYWKGIHVGLRAAVERGPSQGARSGSTGPTWMPFLLFSFDRPTPSRL